MFLRSKSFGIWHRERPRFKKTSPQNLILGDELRRVTPKGEADALQNECSFTMFRQSTHHRVIRDKVVLFEHQRAAARGAVDVDFALGDDEALRRNA